MKKFLSLVLVIALCICMTLPALAEYPQTAEEMRPKRSIESDVPIDDAWVAADGVLYELDFDDNLLEVKYSGYNLLAGDSVITVTNESDETDFYIWIYLDVFQKNDKGQYVNDDPVGASLREAGEFVTCAASDLPEHGMPLKKLYAGDSVQISADTLKKGYAFGDAGDDAIYRVMVYLEWPDEGDYGMYWRSTFYYHVDDEEVARRADAEAKAKAEAEKAKENPFTDVPEDAYYHDAVVWALKNGVTTGTSATTFGPTETCTRGQVATFLWRAKGCPEPKTTVNPFTDVKESDYFYKPVLWALENGITTGTSATTFTPSDTCTSAQVVTFLWRSVGKPAAEGESALAAGYPDQYYTDAVAWADAGGLLAGTGNAFDPAANSPRADIVTYLYRNIAK